MVVIASPVYKTGLPPLVSADGTGFTNTRGIGGDCSVGLFFNIDGEEYRVTQTGAQSGTSQGTWLDQGVPEDVWVEFLRTGGTKTQWVGFSNSTRYQLSSTRKFYITDVTTGAGTETITGSFRFWDAASGGSILDTTTAAQTWIADYEEICPMCCFTPWTLITMADGSQKPIVDVKVGDMIRVQNGIENVRGIITREDRVMYLIKFEDGRVLEASADHPLYVEGKGFAAVNPDPRVDYKDLGLATKLEIGDRVLDGTGRTNRIVSIDDLDYPQTVYTFTNSKFFANGMLVY